MKSLLENRSVSVGWTGPDHPVKDISSAPLDIVVLFTGIAATRTALKAAAVMSRDLNTRIRLVAPQAVPYTYSLERAPISTNFTERVLAELVGNTTNSPWEMAIEIYLCRDRLQTLLKILKPHSLIVIGGRRRIWPTFPSRLAKSLQAHGHEVVFASIPKNRR